MNFFNVFFKKNKSHMKKQFKLLKNYNMINVFDLINNQDYEYL